MPRPAHRTSRRWTVLEKLLGPVADLTRGRPGTVRLGAEQLEDRTVPAAVPFAAPGVLTAALGGAAAVTVADLDGDADPDVLAAGGIDGRVVWFANDGAGGFGPAAVLHTGSAAAWVTAADVDADGRPDVVSADPVAGEVRVARNLGGGAFAPAAAILTAVPGVRRVEPADVDGAGGLDLVFATDAGVFAWAAGTGTGSFGAVQSIATVPAGGVALAVADFDGDGRPDVAAGSAAAGTVTAFRNTGGAFAAGVAVSTTAGQVSALTAADLDGDGDRDLLLADAAGGSVTWYANAAGAFGAGQVVTTATPGAAAVAVGDLDHDGDRDVIVGSAADDTVGWVENLGGGAFATRQVISAAFANLTAVAVADLDADGDVDVLTAAAGGDAVVWHPNGLVRPADLFTARSVIGTGVTRATFTVTADLDRDGDQDVIAVGRGANAVVWFRNDGLGGFGPAQPLAAAVTAPGPVSVSAPFAVAVGDLDGDGDIDVVTRWVTGNALTVHLNRLSEGTADFAPPVIVRTGLTGSRGPDVADLDGDGKLDILAAGGSASTNRVVWYQNLGGGAFGPEQVIGSPAAQPVNVFAADLDGDGKTDVVSSHAADSSLAWYRNLGGGAFDARVVLDPAAGIVFHLAVGDLDGDGDRDVVAVDQAPGANRVLLYRNQGGGVLGPREVLSTFVVSPRSIRLADLDGDLDLDVVTVGQAGNKVAWYENLGGGTFTSQELISNVPLTGYAGAVADLDGDGDNDVVSASYDDDTIAWYRNDIVRRSDRFPGQSVVTTELTSLGWVRAADLDGDGDVDLAGASRGTNAVRWYENDGTGTFGPGRVVAADFVPPGGSSAASPFTVEFADVDGDGDRDAVVVWIGGGAVTWHANRLNEGAADFGPAQVIRSGPGLSGGVGPVLYDVDGDGDTDVVVGATAPTAGNNRVVWYENQAGGTAWVEHVIDAAARGPQFLLATDFDGDGRTDLVASHNTDKTVGWYRNLGGGTFAPRAVLTAVPEAAPYTLAAADLDGDGRKDLVAGLLSAHYVAWYRNNGDGTVGPRQIVSRILRAPRAVATADVDGDGDQDVVAFSQRANKVAWFENLGGGTFRGQQLVSNVPQNTFAGDIADLDGDGDLDLISGGYSDGAIAWYENRGGEFDLTGVAPPGPGTYLAGQPLDVTVTFNEAVAVNTAGGTPSVRLTVGAAVVDAAYVAGSGTPTLTFRYTIQPGDRDADGVVLAGPVQLNGGTLTGPGGVPAPRGFTPPAAAGVFVDGTVPAVLSVARVGASPANAAEVAYTVVFSEPVTGVDAADFGVAAAGLTGARVLGVTGSGDTYTVRVGTGVGDGTLSLIVWDDGSVVDAEANPLGGAANGGTVGPAYAVDRTAPRVAAVATTSPNPSRAAALSFVVTFDEPVSGVDEADFAPAATGGVTGAVVTRVVPGGDGRSYTVTVSTGSGDGTLGLHVLADGSVNDAAGNPLAGAFTTGPTYTVGQGLPGPRFDTFLTSAHSDIRPTYQNGAWDLNVVLSSVGTGVTRYDPESILIAVGPAGRRPQLAGPEWAFIGAGAGNPIWVIPRTAHPELPFFGISGEDAPNGTFARYLESDPRVARANDWIKLSLVEVRGPAGGELSLYTVGDTGPVVWMATANGVTAQDAAWIQEGGHEHYNWAFTRPGLYEVDLRASGYLDANGNGVYDPGTDPFSESPVTTFYFGIDPPNAAPVVTAPSGVTTAAGAAVAFTGPAAVSVSDPDAHPNPARLTLTATGGTVTLAAAPGLTFVTGDGTADAEVVVEGTPAALAAALAGLTFTPAPGFAGTATVNVLVDDGGLYSPVNGQSAEAMIPVTVAAPPPVAVPFGRPGVVGGGFGAVSSVTPADLDGDGDPDLLVGAYGAGRMSWFENLGANSGTFSPERLIATIGSTWYAFPGDLDADGDLDVIASGYSGTFSWYANDGAGNFGPATVIDTDTATPVVALTDFDGDGRLDILAAPDFGTDVRLYRGLAGGGFGPRVTLISGIENSIGLQAADFDGDGDTDLTYGEFQTDTIHVYLNQGGGILGPRVTIAAGDGPGTMGYADFNGDGRGDLLELDFAGAGGLAWHANNGDGTFGPRQVLPAVPGGPYAMATGDVDGDGDTDILSGTFSSQSNLVWLPNLGGGAFGPAVVISQAAGQMGSVTLADFDGDGDADVVAGSYSLGQVLHFENRLGEFATEVVAPTARTYLVGQTVDVTVHVGVPVAVTGAPSVALQIGTRTVQAVYVSGAGTLDLLFRYTVATDDLDADGVTLGSAVALNGGTLTGPTGEPVNPSLPGADLSGVKVNGSAPVVRSVTRLDPAATAAGTVRFAVTFSEAVTGVDGADFEAATGLTGAAVTGVTGSGAAYTVSVSTGTGSGVLGLTVVDGARVADAAGNRLGEDFADGEVYTLNRRPARTIDAFYQQGHGDIGIGYADGQWELTIHPDELGGDFPPDEVLIYSSAAGLRDTPTGPQWAFLGAGPRSYWLPQSGSANPDVPELGIAGEGVAGGTFASYANADPRVAATGAWVRLQAVGLRAPAGGHVSIYTSGDAAPTVWVATADGITAADSVYILAGSHNHFNFAFTAAGLYEVDVVASGFLDANGNGTFDEGVDRYTESGVTTYYFQIDTPGGPVALSLPADPLPPVPLPDPEPEPPPAPPVRQPITATVPADGAVRLTHADGGTTSLSPFPGFTGPIRTATADLNGDGVADVIAAVGTGAAPHVKVLDGMTGRELMSFYAYGADFTGGVSVAAGDVTGDGVPDVITAAGAGAGPHVKVFDGKTGAEVRSFFAYDAAFAGGVSVAAADLDGDGRADIVTGTLSGAPHVKAFDGATGTEVLSFYAYASTFGGGVFVAAGDLDGDGKAEVVTGTGAGGGSHVKLFDGRTGAERGGFMAYADSFRGGVRVAVADTDGDGRAELVTGAGPGGAPHVKVFDGRTLAVVDEFMSGDPTLLDGVFVG